ncbi:putative leucoanthocyanidin dioxygenase [Lophiostoma macrostomum CBS 122681]|uniref:Putative leucoanthocyanidin dioxygenase n=1 Tax=Lophiostoma macrostomum CBS 122681 TaxID=1314788 RepID=A0A6A6STL0_9PLEO|nr:putative leucoanthocyanidin dioxygenase [Lophiostoma macrostomum CBS 122681]
MTSNTEHTKAVQHEVPIIDISPFVRGDDIEAQRRVSKELAKKASANGCVGISGHGISADLLAEAFGVTKKLFDLPYTEKMKAPHPNGPTPHRGYSGTGRERGAAKTETEEWNDVAKEASTEITDYKETYEIGSDENKIQYNIWLPDDVFPGFRTFTTKLYWEMHKTAMSILEALISSLDLTEEEADNVRKLHTGYDSQLRLAHYPPIPGDRVTDPRASRLGAHTDWSSFTLLFQDENGGLQFLDRASNEFIDAVPKDGVLYMNIADMFQRISNGFYPSALHRVIIKNSTASRYSIPYFVPPSGDGLIEPQPSRVEKDGKRVYEPVTFNEYATRMFETTGYAKQNDK